MTPLRSETIPRRPGLSVYGIVALCSRVVLKTAFHLTVISAEAIPPAGPLIVVANHESYLDGPVLAAVLKERRLTFLSARYLFQRRFLGWLLRAVGALLVTADEGNLSSLKRAIEVLREGNTIVVFPEGGIARDTVLGGGAYLALKTGAPLLPVRISGTKEALPPGETLPFLTPITVSIGPPITPAEFNAGGLDRRAAVAAGRQTLARALAEGRTTWRDICRQPHESAEAD